MKLQTSKVREKILETGSKINQEVPKPSLLQVTVLVMLALPALYLREYFVAFMLMILTVILSLAVNRFEAGRFGIELATFSAVTMATLFPPRIAAVLGFIYIVLQIFSGSTPGIYLVWVIPTYTFAAYIISTIPVTDIVQIGLTVTIASQMFFAFMTFLTTRGRLPKYLQYATFNLAFNFLMFQTFAEPLLDLINS